MGHESSYVFRGHKFDIYEGGHRMPLVIRWPQTIAPGSVTDETVCLADLLATCAEILGVTLPDNAGEDSVSNLPVWQGGAMDTSQRAGIVHSSFNGSLSIRKGKWKLVALRDKPWELYDLEADRSELNNLADKHPEKTKALAELWEAEAQRTKIYPKPGGRRKK